MSNPISKIPILLFPLKLETRFVDSELWIRVFPDDVLLQSHNPSLSTEEKIDAIAFKELDLGEAKQAAWEALVSKYGVYRSTWISRITSEELLAQQNNNDDEIEPSFHFKWLPDRFVFYLYKRGATTPTYKKNGSVIDREKLVVLGEGDEWLQDFNVAISLGMGIKITIDPDDDKFDKLIVSGFKYDIDPLAPTKGLTDLFENHQYTNGISFLPYGTPTNNTETVRSGHSSREEFEAANSYDYAVKGLDMEIDSLGVLASDIHFSTAGEYLSNGLGFQSDYFKNLQNADQTPNMLNEVFQKASWFALGAQPLSMLFGNQIGSETHEALWKHYSKYVKSRGLYDAIKVGNQPYGILPVMNLRNVLLPENSDILQSAELYDKMRIVLAHLMERWLLMTKSDPTRTLNEIPRLTGNDSYEKILQILSMQEASSSYQIRAMEYQYFRKELYETLNERDPNFASILDFLSTRLNYDNTEENISSLTDLLNIDNQELSATIDQLLRAPILSFIGANSNLIKFHEGNSVITDPQGNTIPVEDDGLNSFSFTQEDLTNFQDFINELREQTEGELIQYKGELSFFTDLFLRSYSNACQLYYREVVFELPVVETSSTNGTFKIGNILKAENSIVQKGDPILEILDSSLKKITIKAPFGGKIKKMFVTANSNEQIKIGKTLFLLINETKFNEIKSLFITLGQQIIDSSNAIAEGKDRVVAQKNAIGEAIDLNSYRLDAWITSLAARRMEEMRNEPGYENGIYFGAYGWVENLEKNPFTPRVRSTTLTDIYRDAGGIIHTPGTAQSVAATVFKNSFLAHKQEEHSNPFTINLTSDRIQKGQVLLEGIRQGQQFDALLGYQLESFLQQDNLHHEIYILREAFPLNENTTANNKGFINLSVIDGLKAINAPELPIGILPAKREQVYKQIEKLKDSMDACLDMLFYETGYQITQGNLSQAAAAMASTKGEIEPPMIESLKTKISGSGIKHKLVMVMPKVTDAYLIDNPRGFMEPNLEKWMEENMGPMDTIGCLVELYDPIDDRLIDTKEVSLANLNMGYLDFLYLSEEQVSQGASELELRIKNYIYELNGNLALETKYIITNAPINNGQSLIQAVEFARYAKALISKCRYLKSEDLILENESVHYDSQGLTEIKDQRLIPIIARLRELVDSDLTQNIALKFLSLLDFELAKVALLGETAIDLDKLKIAIQAKITLAEEVLSRNNTELSFYVSFENLREVARILFGETFILLPPAKYSNQFAQLITDEKQSLLIGDVADNTTNQVWGQERINNWIQGIAQVHENSETFEDWLMVNKVWSQGIGNLHNYEFKIVQGPTLLQYPWVGLSKNEIDLLLTTKFSSEVIYADSTTGEAYPLTNGKYYPEGCESIVMYVPQTLAPQDSIYGLVIEEFSEHIPDQKVDTALSFNYNAPNTEAPQALLLAIHPKATMQSNFLWSEDDLKDILYDTIDLYKIRMVDIDAIQEYGYVLPLTYWFNIPANK